MARKAKKTKAKSVVRKIASYGKGAGKDLFSSPVGRAARGQHTRGFI